MAIYGRVSPYSEPLPAAEFESCKFKQCRVIGTNSEASITYGSVSLFFLFKKIHKKKND